MEKAEPIFTKPYYIAKIWAAPSAKRWGKDGIGEAVLFSAAPDCPVMTPKGATCGRELLRRNIAFPRQVKAIATALPLSVQVHPVGKNEVWYIDSATAGARVYVGFRRRYSFCELQEACAAGTVCFLRVNPQNHSETWNETTDQSIPADKNLFSITGFGEGFGAKSTGEWSVK